MEVGKEGHKETLNPMHQCSPLFQNNSGCSCIGSLKKNSETTHFLVRKLNWVSFHCETVKERVGPVQKYTYSLLISHSHIFYSNCLGCNCNFSDWNTNNAKHVFNIL